MQSLFRANRKPTISITQQYLRYLYWSNYIASSAAYHHFKQHTAIEALRVQHAYARKPRTGLWWWIAAETKLNEKGFIKNHYTKRVRRAFAQALLDKGYGSDGVRISGENGTEKEGLKGSLQLMLSASASMVTDEELKQECERILDQITLPEGERPWKRIAARPQTRNRRKPAP